MSSSLYLKTPFKPRILLYISFLIYINPVNSFSLHQKIPNLIKHLSRRTTNTELNLIPLSEFSNNDVSFLTTPETYRLCIGSKGQLRPYNKDTSDELPYILCIAEEDDLPAISRLTVDAFGAGTITLSHELNELERALIGPTVGLWNEYTDTMAFTEVLSGLRSRMKDRIVRSDDDAETAAPISIYKRCLGPPMVSNGSSIRFAIDLAEKASIIFVLARENPLRDDIECVATVELRLQPTDGKIPFSQPWLDRYERKLAKFLKLGPSRISTSETSSSADHNLPPKKLQPYLSNLCVSKAVRGRKIGKAMVRCVESIATESWGYKKLYLHVDLENEPALNLYKSEGFKDVGLRWNPFWSGKAADIGYFVKNYKK